MMKFFFGNSIILGVLGFCTRILHANEVEIYRQMGINISLTDNLELCKEIRLEFDKRPSKHRILILISYCFEAFEQWNQQFWDSQIE